MKTKIKRIKDNITKHEYKTLIAFLKDDDIREHRKQRLLRVFTILYHTGIRVNETQQLTYQKIRELIQNKRVKIIAHKQKIEKWIRITEQGAKDLKRLFPDTKEGFIITSERGNKKTPLEIPAMILDVNTYLKKVFPDKNITSHSFRQSLITELSENGVNTKVIQNLVSHSDIKTTFRYIKPSDTIIDNALEVVR